MKRIAIVLICFALVACAPSTESIQTAIAQTASVWTPIPSQTAYPTFTAPPTVYVTKIVLITSTLFPTPLYTPTVTNTPEPPTATPDLLKADKDDGFYLVNIDIAPGVWRSTGKGTDCYWKRSTVTGDIIDNHFGQAGGTIYIAPSDFQVQFKECGIWQYLSPP